MQEPPKHLPASPPNASAPLASAPLANAPLASAPFASAQPAAQPLAPPKPRRTVRFLLALVVALASDLIGAPLELAPPISIGLDVVTALVLWAILGRGWLLLVALVLEAIPGVGLVPFWTMAVCSTELLTASAQMRMKQVLGRKGAAGAAGAADAADGRRHPGQWTGPDNQP